MTGAARPLPVLAFQEISVRELSGLAPAIRCSSVFPPACVSVPAPEFGDSEGSLRRRGIENFANGWGAASFVADEVARWTLPDALVHGPFGIVTVGKYVIAESTIHAPLHLPAYRKEAGVMCLPAPSRVLEVEKGLHFASGNYGNYYHWMLDVVPKLQIAPFCDFGFDGMLLMPPGETAFHRCTTELLDRLGLGYRHLGAGEAARVAELVLIPNMTACGPRPHPALSQFFTRLAAEIGARSLPDRRLYVSRGGSGNRPLANEAAVIRLVSANGYDVCDPGQMRLRDQIAVFASATHIIAPHGAGLANIVFCRPGARLCELHMPTYENWCFRRLAAIRDMRYGLVLGAVDPADEREEWVHSQRWHAPLDRIDAVMRQMDS